MKVVVKKFIAVFYDEDNSEMGFAEEHFPQVICDEDGVALVANTYDEIYSLIMDDIDFWRNNRPVPENHGFERKGDEIKVWDDYATVRYTIKEIEIEVEIK